VAAVRQHGDLLGVEVEGAGARGGQGVGGRVVGEAREAGPAAVGRVVAVLVVVVVAAVAAAFVVAVVLAVMTRVHRAGAGELAVELRGGVSERGGAEEGGGGAVIVKVAEVAVVLAAVGHAANPRPAHFTFYLPVCYCPWGVECAQTLLICLGIVSQFNS